MAIDVYVDSLMTGTPRKLTNAFHDDGVIIKRAYSNSFAKGAGDGVGSIYRAFKGLPCNLIPLSIRYAGQAIAAFTVTCGLYLTGNVIPGGPIGTPAAGPAANKSACFAAATSVAAGAINFKEAVALDLFTAIDAAFVDPFTRLFEYAGYTAVNRPATLDLALTSTVDGGNAGNFVLMLEYTMG